MECKYCHRAIEAAMAAFNRASSRPPSPGSTTLSLSCAHDKARDLPPYRPERVEEVLWDWAMNYDQLDIHKIMAELKQLYHAQEAEDARKERQLFGGW